jgi:hypothetical protein
MNFSNNPIAMKKPLVLLVLVLCARASFCQLNHPPSDVVMTNVTQKFMEMFKNGKYDEGFDMLKSYTVIEDYKMDTLAYTAKHQLTALGRAFGKAISFELASKSEIPNSLIKLIYLLKYERAFLEVRFVLYNNGSGWTITSFRYDEKTDELFPK